jgi:excinuclease UvrABC ATPase subunit
MLNMYSTGCAIGQFAEGPGHKRNNVDHLDVEFPIGAVTAVTGVSGSGKSSLGQSLATEASSSKRFGCIDSRPNRRGMSRFAV